jgi:hypothetical protein
MYPPINNLEPKITSLMMFVGKDAMCTFLNPIDDILATTLPKEAHPNSEQRFVDAKVTTNGAAMKHVKD